MRIGVRDPVTFYIPHGWKLKPFEMIEMIMILRLWEAIPMSMNHHFIGVVSHSQNWLKRSFTCGTPSKTHGFNWGRQEISEATKPRKRRPKKVTPGSPWFVNGKFVFFLTILIGALWNNQMHQLRLHFFLSTSSCFSTLIHSMRNRNPGRKVGPAPPRSSLAVRRPLCWKAQRKLSPSSRRRRVWWIYIILFCPLQYLLCLWATYTDRERELYIYLYIYIYTQFIAHTHVYI